MLILLKRSIISGGYIIIIGIIVNARKRYIQDSRARWMKVTNFLVNLEGLLDTQACMILQGMTNLVTLFLIARAS